MSQQLDRGERRGSAYIAELEAFLTFIRSVWGLLASVSAFFPLSNALMQAIPLGAYGEDGVFDRIPPGLISTIATVVTLFVVFTAFAGRDRVTAGRRPALRAAWISLAVGLLCLGVYLVLHAAYAEYAWTLWSWGSGDPRKLSMEIPLAAMYVAFFALLTRAFVLVAMAEFYSDPTNPSADAHVNGR